MRKCQRLRGGGGSRSRTRLSLHFGEVQGDFVKMQGVGREPPGKNY